VAVSAAVAAAFTLWIASRPPAPRPSVVAAGAPDRGAPSPTRPDGTPDHRGSPSASWTSLVSPRGGTARATIGTRVRLTLVGDGRVSVLPATGADDVELSLDAGRLLVDYDGHAGGTLRVRSPGAVTTVVGTLFAVEVTRSGSRVAVARGQVRTESSSGAEALVPAGSSWTSAEGRLAPIPRALAKALAAHEAAWTAPALDPARSAADRPAPERRAAAVPRAADLDLEALYARAEAAMRERSLAEARRTLETIARRDPHGALGEAALLDLARLALADGDRAEARRALSRLPDPLSDPAFTDTAAHLRCRAEQPEDAGSPVCSPAP
jgi:hypothetical protein